MKKIAEEGARTIPGREHGGNCDVSICLLSEVSKKELMGLVDQESVKVRSCTFGVMIGC